MIQAGKMIIGLLLTTSSFQLMAQSVAFKIENIRASRGTIKIAVYRDAKSFDEDKPFITEKISKQSVENGDLSINIPLESGNYGVAILDDENNDDKMEYNLLRIPKEGFGFSDYYSSGLKRPDFSDFDFDVTDTVKNVVIRIKYM
jgi:uncharacterized protein (DUF2141 family)